MAEQKQDDQHEHTFSNYVRIQDVVMKTCQKRWTIGKSGERGSGISVLAARHDDDDDYAYKTDIFSYYQFTKLYNIRTVIKNMNMLERINEVIGKILHYIYLPHPSVTDKI